MTQNNVGIYASQISGHLYGGPYGAYDALATVTLSSATSSITFAGIPTGYKHLQLRGIQIAGTGGNAIGIQFNGVTSGYAMHTLSGDGASASAAGYTSRSSIYLFGYRTGTSTTYPAAMITDILDYANTTKNKTIRVLSGADYNGSGEVELNSGLFIDTSTINSINLINTAGNFAQYSQFALYGIK